MTAQQQQDLITTINLVLTCIASFQAQAANKRAKRADEKAETALTQCTYPDCGHTCEPAPAPAPARPRPKTKQQE